MVKKMKLYLFFREGHFYPIEEENDEKVLKHVPLNPGTLKIETLAAGTENGLGSLFKPFHAFQ